MPTGATTRDAFPLWHIQKPPVTVRPAEGAGQSSHLGDARRHAGTTPGYKKPWPIPSPQPQASFRGTASRLPLEYGQGPRGPLRTPRPTNIIYHRSPTPVQEAPHRTGAHPHHSHASRARATGSASRGPPPGGGRSVQLICRLSSRVSGRPAVGGTTRHGHAAKGACGRPKACARDRGTALRTAPKPPRHGEHIATTGTRREAPKGGRRNDRDLRPSGVR